MISLHKRLPGAAKQKASPFLAGFSFSIDDEGDLRLHVSKPLAMI
jgi:hypothetical protein